MSARPPPPPSSQPPPRPPAPPPSVPARPWGARRAEGPYSSYYGGGEMLGMGAGGIYGSAAAGAMYRNPWNYQQFGYSGAYSPGGVVGGTALPSLAHLAEERSRPAFETILSVVNGFNSVGAMLESIYLALHSCLRAVVGVVEAAAKARAQMAHFVSAFAALRFLRSAYSAVRRLLGLSAPLEESWNEQSSTSTLDSSSPSPSVNWPLALYGGLVLAAPYLMWRAAGGGEGGEASSTGQEWDPEEEESLVAEALYPFSPEAPEVEVALTAEGKRVLVAPRHRQPRVRGWLLCKEDGGEGKVGLVPANYVKIVGRRKPSKQQQQQKVPDLISAQAATSEDKKIMEEAFEAAS